MLRPYHTDRYTMRYLISLLLLAITACTLTTTAPTPPQPTPTNTLPPSATPPITVTPGPTVTTRPTDAPACVPRADWINLYTVAAGDTLLDIARRGNTSANELIVGNCLQNGNIISVGQVLRSPNPIQAPLPPTVSLPNQVYTNAEIGFSLEYPGGWSQVAQANYVDFVAPDGRVFEVLFGQPASSVEQAAADCKASPLCIGNRTILSEQQVVLPDGLVGIRLELSANLSDPTSQPAVYVFLIINGRSLLFRGFGSSFAYFNTILNSLYLLRF
jgi:LysM repeat protein